LSAMRRRGHPGSSSADGTPSRSEAAEIVRGETSARNLPKRHFFATSA
jgi:hypothetical protein